MTDKNLSVETPVQPATRRRFLGRAAAGAAGAAAMAAPMVSVAQSPVVLKMQGAWGAKDIFNEMAEEYVKRVNEMAGGRLRIDYLVAGAVVKPFEVMDATSKGVLDACHGVPVYWYGKSKVASLFGSGPINGCDAHQTLAWIYRGGGLAALQRAAQEDQPRRGRLLRDADADPAAGLVQEADHAGLGAEGPEVPHRRPGGRPVPGDGRQGHAAARRRNHPGAREGRDRRLRVQQSDLRHALRRAGRDQELHDGQLPPGDGVLRDRLQQEASATRSRRTCRRSCSTPSRRPRRRTGGRRWTTTRATCRS